MLSTPQYVMKMVNSAAYLEMMQDCTHIRELEGSRTLLTWDKTEFVGNAENSW